MYMMYKISVILQTIQLRKQKRLIIRDICKLLHQFVQEPINQKFGVPKAAMQMDIRDFFKRIIKRPVQALDKLYLFLRLEGKGTIIQLHQEHLIKVQTILQIVMQVLQVEAIMEERVVETGLVQEVHPILAIHCLPIKKCIAMTVQSLQIQKQKQ